MGPDETWREDRPFKLLVSSRHWPRWSVLVTGPLSETRRFHGQDFFPWYNTEHHHSSLGLLTPHDVHYGLAAERVQARAAVLGAAFTVHPDRFVAGRPRPQDQPTAVWINPPKALPPLTEENRQ
jgi:hypothetical protein